MQSNTLAGLNGEEPDSTRFQALKEFHSAGRGFWADVSEADWTDWRWQLKNRITSLEQLQRLLPTLTPEEYAGTLLANKKLALAIPPYFFNLIDPADENCPIRRQVVPRAQETHAAPWEMSDPCGEDAHSPVPGPVRGVLPVLHAFAHGEQRGGLRFSSGVRPSNRICPPARGDSGCVVERRGPFAFER
jgi:hypothetical protein